MSDKKDKDDKLGEYNDDEVEDLTEEQLAELERQEEEAKAAEKARRKEVMIKRQAKMIGDHNILEQRTQAPPVSGSGSAASGSSRSAVSGSAVSVKAPTFCAGGEMIEDFDVAQTLRKRRLENGEFRMKSGNAANALRRQGFYLIY